MFDKDVLRLPGIRKIIGLLVGNSLLQAIFIIMQGLALSKGIVQLWKGQSMQSAIGAFAIFGIAFILHYLCDALRDKFLIEYSRNQSLDLRNQLLKKVFQLGPVLIRQKGTGNVVSMAMEGIDQVQQYLQLVLAKAIDMTIIPIVVLIVSFWLNWICGIILLCAFPLIILFMIILGQAAQSKADQQYQLFQSLENNFTDSIRGLKTLKQLGISKRYEHSIFKTSERFRKATMNTLVVAMTSTFALDFFTTLSIAIIAVCLGFRLINGQITLFPALAILILAPEYFLPIQNFGNDYHATLNGKNSFKAINQILQMKVPVTANDDIQNWDIKSTLEVRDLNVAYDEDPTLKDLAFKITGMTKIGIVGLSGSGKSTLINTLSGLMSSVQGQIRINNQDVKTFRQQAWQKQLIYIPQNPYIFQLSVRDNIRFYVPTASEEQINRAVDVVGLRQFVDQLPHGLDTIIGEGGRALSGGQAQRIALARAFLDNSRHVMLFDEPTAHLDIETESELKTKMLKIMENHLVFFATHRLHWMKQMDYILVLKDGQIVEQGTLAKLIEQNGELMRMLKKVHRNES